MKLRRLGMTILVIFAGPVLAQPKAAESELRTDKLSEMPPQEQMAKSAEYIQGMRKQLTEVLKKLEEARDSKDVVKLNCVNEKLTQIKGLVRIAEQADVALQEAVAKREKPTADHEFTKVAIANDKVRQLRAEAEECIGITAFDVGKQTIEVITPEGLPTTDPSEVPPQPPVVTRPPSASPTI